MNDMMTFPNTWEEFERVYGITDREEIYTNGARLIPSFRVKQWLDHIAELEKHTEERAETHACDLIDRQAAIDALGGNEPVGDPSKMDDDDVVKMWERIRIINIINELPSAQPDRKTGRWIDHEEDGYLECPLCGSATNCDGDRKELHYCFYCGSRLE